MKNYIFLLFILVPLTSCSSDNLSNSKAENLISDCLKLNPEQRTSHITIGKATFRNNENDQKLLAKYLKLSDDGYLELKLIKTITKGWNKGAKEYSINLKEKALEYMEEVPEISGNAIAKAFNYEVSEVLEVHEMPSVNTATVKVNYKASNITPFAILSRKDPSDFWVKKLTFTKTSNGWKYCDNF